MRHAAVILLVMLCKTSKSDLTSHFLTICCGKVSTHGDWDQRWNSFDRCKKTDMIEVIVTEIDGIDISKAADVAEGLYEYSRSRYLQQG